MIKIVYTDLKLYKYYDHCNNNYVKIKNILLANILK